MQQKSYRDGVSEGEDRWVVPAEVLALPGFKVLEALHAFGRTVRIFRANTAALTDWLARTDDPAVLFAVWNANDRDQFERHFDETERLFFNFLASAQARVDYCRVIVNRGLLDGTLADAYQTRVQSTFRLDPVHNWMVGIRNHMLHHRLPVSRGHLEISTSHVKSTIVFETRSLLASDGFNPSARQWMADRTEIDLRETVEAYATRVDEFDEWFSRAYAEHHLEVSEAFLAAKQGHAKHASRRWSGPTERTTSRPTPAG
jgi:hypothetical protein